MIEVIPAIIAKTKEELESKIKLIEPYATWVQIDVADGKFVPNITINDPREIAKVKANLKIEFHLMIQNPEDSIADWIEAGARRVIVHIESSSVLSDIIESCHEALVQIGVALNPETSLEQVEPYLHRIDEVLFLSVRPGFAGGEFIPDVIEKIIKFRKAHPDVIIGIDGGIRKENIHLAARAGANRIYAQSAIFGAKDVRRAIEELKEEAERVLQE